MLEIPEGIPSYTTFWTVFALLDPTALEKSFVHWVEAKVSLKNGDIVSIDGKAQRGTAKRGRPHSFVHIVERQLPDQAPSIETRYYISSLSASALKMAGAIRSHWSIENQAHWILDVALREDEQKAKTGNIAENLSVIRRIALNMLKQERSAKCGIEIKRQMAGWDNKYLLKVIGVKFFS